MPAARAAERLAAAHSEVKRACDLLIASSPGALENCQQALSRAVSELTDFRAKYQASPDGRAARGILVALRADLLRAGRLLQSLAGFYEGWEAILGAMTAGYSANGDAVPVARKGRLVCRG